MAKCGDLSDKTLVYVGDWVFEKRPDMVGQRCWFQAFVSDFGQNNGVVDTVKKIQMFVRLQLSILHKLNRMKLKKLETEGFTGVLPPSDCTHTVFFSKSSKVVGRDLVMISIFWGLSALSAVG